MKQEMVSSKLYRRTLPTFLFAVIQLCVTIKRDEASNSQGLVYRKWIMRLNKGDKRKENLSIVGKTTVTGITELLWYTVFR